LETNAHNGHVPEEKRIDEIDERSEQVREVMGRAPGWTIIWGTTIIFSCVFFLFLISYLVKYPDLVQARIVITTPKPPMGVTAQASGKLNPIFVEEKQRISEGDILAIIENAASTKDVAYLKSQLELFSGVKDTSGHGAEMKIEFPEKLVLGEIQKDYSLFLKDFNAYKSFLVIDPVNREIKSVEAQLYAYYRLIAEQQKQDNMFRQELNLAQLEYDRNKRLHLEKVIADKDMEDKELDLIRVKRSYKNFQLEMAGTEIQLAELKKTFTQLSVRNSENTSQLSLTLHESCKNMQGSIALWEHKYILKAPVDGKVTFFKYWSRNQYVKSDDEVFVVVPEGNSEIIGRMIMPIRNSGKVVKGQRVNVRIDSYPFQQYGALIGIVESISLVPRDNMYAITVKFADGLNTTYKKRLPMMQEMGGSADIITEDLRMLERIFYPFKSIFKQNTY
jgi:multidrug resistance efflux pump